MLWLTLDALLTRARPRRERLSLLLDAVVVALAWQATYLFRLGFRYWIVERPRYDIAVMAGLVALYVLVLWLFKVPKGMWRFSGFGEIKRLTAACALAGLVGATVVLMAHLSGIPRAVLALHPVFCVIGLAMMRMGYRMLYEHMRGRISGSAQETHRALVMGAGQAGRLAVAGIQHQGFTVVGWLDDDANKAGARVAGIPVIGRLDDAPAMAEVHGITHLIVAMPAAARQARRRALDIAGSTGLHVLTVPSSEELLHGRRVDEVRDIEPEDLLGREPVKLDESGIAECLSGKVVLITGAGGSIGSELCRQVARYAPRRLVLVELSEFNLYTIEQELGQLFPDLELVRLICDVKDLAGLRRIFSAWTPHVVFHAAAYKHVPLMEQHNSWAALRNNTLGTYNAALAAGESCAERFVLISTDKAVNPTNVMGATKRAAEMVVSSLVGDFPGTRFMAVRFGNVLGSSGSVIPKFKEQIERGGPITVTHPDIIRYFMTIPEAARLVIQAAAIGQSGQVLVLDMGEPVKIVDLARDMIKLSGHSVDDIRIVFTGLRPGEKLFEELLADADSTVPTAIQALRIARIEVEGDVAELLAFAGGAGIPEDASVRAALQRVVNSYGPAAG
jgi:FlaA1/EpsC-like NDP-sugar epimerase